MNVTFYGASNTVTGSCHLVTTDKYKFLLDCGMFQGGKTLEARNEEDFPFNPAEIDFVILSHAHVDHCGRLPLLVKRGFKGNIYCTKTTADLIKIMLVDCGYIHEKDAIWETKRNERKGKPPVAPLYTVEDAKNVFPYLTPILYDQLIHINDDCEICFNDAGHILGSAITEIWLKDSMQEHFSKIVFTGDLGMKDRPILRDPTPIKHADYVLMESTYGNRLHEPNPTSVDKLIKIIAATYKKGGNVIIPSFAVGRTQELIFELNKYYDGTTPSPYSDILKNIDVYIDSPMAASVTKVFEENPQVFDEEARSYILRGDNPLKFKNLHFTETTADSMALNNDDGKTKIIISASGMCDAGRIRHHLKHGLWNPKNSVVFVGYQAAGTLGRMIVDGNSDVTIMGEVIHVGATIYNLEGFSGHADRDGLLDWLKNLKHSPKKIFLVHGEMDAKHDFANFVKEEIGLDCTVIEGPSTYELSEAGSFTKEDAITDVIDEEQLAGIHDQIGTIHDHLESILYNAKLAAGSNISADQLMRINNVVQELERDVMKLGAITSENPTTKEPL